MVAFTALAASALVPMALASPLVAVRDAVPSYPAATGFMHSGQGCPVSAASSVVASPSFDVATFIFTQLGADTASKDGNATEACEVMYQGKGGAAGYQVSVSEVDITGTLILPKGDELDIHFDTFWSANAADTLVLEASVTSTNGSYAKAGVYTFSKKVTDPVWSQCIGSDGNPGQFNADLRVGIDGDNASFKVATETIYFQWRKC